MNLGSRGKFSYEFSLSSLCSALYDVISSVYNHRTVAQALDFTEVKVPSQSLHFFFSVGFDHILPVLGVLNLLISLIYVFGKFLSNVLG